MDRIRRNINLKSRWLAPFFSLLSLLARRSEPSERKTAMHCNATGGTRTVLTLEPQVVSQIAHPLAFPVTRGSQVEPLVSLASIPEPAAQLQHTAWPALALLFGFHHCYSRLAHLRAWLHTIQADGTHKTPSSY